MNANTVTPLDKFFLGLYVFITLMSIYQACVNLFFGKISSFSIDAILLYLILKFGDEKARKRTQIFSKNVDRIMLLGVYAALTAIGGIYAIIDWFEKFGK